MKKLINLIFILILSVSVSAQGDACSNAVNLGTLNNPAACPTGGAGTSTVYNGTTVGATAENPYSALACMDSPAADRWVTFTATGNELDINLTSGLNDANMGLYTGSSCAGLTGYMCVSSNNGNASFTDVPVVPGQQYYLQISGINATDFAAFTLTLTPNNNCSVCLVAAGLTASPAPVGGFYLPNTTVTFCLNVTNFNQIGANWISGVLPTLSSNWNTTMTPVSNPPGGSGYAWFWSNTGPFGAGYYVDEDPIGAATFDGNFTNNYGDPTISGTGSWSFCFQATTSSICTPGGDLGISVNTLSDYETGGYGTAGCVGDPNIVFAAEMQCCDIPLITSVPTTCAGTATGSATAEGQGGVSPYDYYWENSSGANISTQLGVNGVSSLGGLIAGLYTVTVIDATGCQQIIDIVVTDGPDCTCLITNMFASVGACQPDNTFNVTGDFTYSNNPGTGTFVVDVTNGSGTQTQVFSPPFVDGTTYNFNVTGNVADGSGVTVTVYFSDDLSCTANITSTSPNDCACNANVGTFTAGITGVSANNFVLCFGDVLNLSSNGDGTNPGEATSPPGPTYDPGIAYVAYECPPTVFPQDDFTTDPCVLGVVTYNDIFNSTNSGGQPPYAGTFTNNTIYYVPITVYSVVDGFYSYTNTSENCYDMGQVFAVQYLPQITFTQVQDCQAGTATATLNGGQPAVDGTSYTTVPGSLTPVTASFGNTTATVGGTITITGLVNGDNYSYQVQDANGCPRTITGTFTGVTSSAFTYPQSAYCKNGTNPSPIISGVGGGTFTSTAGLSINATSGVINLAASTAATYTVTYTSPGAPCNSSSTFVITINPVPVIVVPNVAMCLNGSAVLNASGADTYTWSPGATLSATTGPSVTATPATTTVYTINGTNTTTSCIGTTTATVTVNPLPTISGTLNVCAGLTRQLTGSATANGTTPWVSSNTGVATVNSTGLVSGVSAGTTDITYTNTNGCQVTVTFTVNALPTIVANDPSVCTTSTVALTASGASTYTWSPGTSLSGTTGPSVTFTPGVSGNYTVTGTDANGCINTDVSTVTVLANAPIVASADVTICNGATTNISASGGVSYTWNQSLGAGQNFNVSPSTTTTYTVTGTDAAGCVGSDQVIVTVNPVPTVNAVTPQSICAGANTTTITFSGAVAGTTYNWTNSNSTIGLAASGSGDITSFTGINTGSVDQVANITVTPTANGCPGTPINFSITVKPTPTVNAIPNQVMCANTPTTAVNFTGLVTPTTYNWTNSNGAIGLATSGTGDISSVTATNGTGAPIMGTITVTPTANGCPGSPQNFTITVNPIPTVAAVADQVICANANTTTVAFTGNVTGATYNWTNSNSSIGLAASGSGDITSFTGLNSSASSQVATINVTPTANGCPGTPTSFTITVNPIPTVNSVSNQVLCANATTGQVDFSGLVAGTTYNWANSNTSIGLAGSGSGTINSFTAINTGSTPVVSTITVTPVSAGCSGTPINFTITVNPTPTVNPVGNQTVCANGNTTDVIFSGNVAGTTYNWTNTNSSIGLASSGNGNILSFTGLNGGSTAQVGTINITPTVNGCPGTPTSFTITVNPTPVITAVTNQTVCSGTVTSAVNFASSVAGTNYSWTNSNSSIGLAASGNGNIGGFTATNFTASQISGVITITPSANACPGLPTNFTIFVNPLPTATVTGTAAVCENGTSPVVTFTGGNGTPNYTFTYNINGGANQTIVSSGNTATINAPTTPTGSFNYNLISVSDASSTTCSQAQGGSATITVNPNPTPTIVGATEYCTGSTSSVSTSLTYSTYLWSPNGATTQTTNVTNADNPITVMVTNGFGCQGTSAPFTVTENSVITYDTQVEICQGQSATIHGISRTVANVYSQTFTLPTGCDSTSNVTLIVHALPVIDAGPDVTVCEGTQVLVNATGAPTITWSPVVTNGQYITQAPSTVVYTATGTDVNGCQNTDAFSVTVNPTPSANPIASQTICASTNTTAINFSGPIAGTTYNWTNDNASIGTAASGTGNIAAFTGVNAGATSVTGNFTVTPTANSCPGTPIQFSITVNPIPSVDPIANQTICANTSTAAVTISGPVSGTTYNWINSNTTIGIGGTGSGSIAPFTGTNAGTTVQTGNFTVTPVANGCAGPQRLFSITVNPIPVVSSAPDQTVCQGTATTAANFTSGVAGTTYSWTNNNGGIGLATSGTGSIASFTSTNGGSAPITGTISVTPTANTCNGVVDQFLITVNPTPSVNAISNQTLCAGIATTAVSITGPVAGTTYNWTNTNTSIGLAASGNGSIGAFTATNSTNTIQTATITVTPTASSCPGPTRVFTITVNPTPDVATVPNQIICAGTQTSAINFTSGVTGTTFGWTNNNPGIGLAASGNGNIGAFTGINSGSTAVIGNINVTPTANGCAGSAKTTTIRVNPLPLATIAGTASRCINGSSPAITFTGSNGVAPYTFSYTLNGVANTITSSGNTATINAPTNVAGSFVYSLVSVTDASTTACSRNVSGSATVTINALPPVNAGVDEVRCIGQQVTLTATGANTYSWSPSITNGVAFYPSLGSQNYIVTGTDGNGCVNKDTVNVFVNPLPIINAGPDIIVCIGDDATLAGQSNISGTTFTWTAPVIENTPFSPTTTATYTVTGTDPNGCQNTDNVVVTVRQLPIINAGNDLFGCEDDDFTLSGSGPAGTSYSWDNGVTNNVSFVSPVGSTTYTVTGTDPYLCENTDQVTILVEQAPMVDFYYDPDGNCAPVSVLFTNNSTPAGVNCIWNFDDGSVVNGCGPIVHTFTTAGTYGASLQTETAISGCVGTFYLADIIVVEAYPIASFTANPLSATTMDTEIDFINQSTGASGYEWTFGDGSPISNVQDPSHTYSAEEAGSYNVMLVASTPLGCTDTTFRVIKIDEELLYYVPNSFTPDQNEFNEVFQPVFTSGFDPYDFEMLIFNRWGEIVFETHDASIGWDGTYGVDGKISQDGTYTWKISFKTLRNDERKILVGHVNLIR